MSTEIANPNEACCTIPPVVAKYEPKGTFKAYGGYDKVYVVGPESTNKAVLVIFDIFGFWPQTQQGADIVAETLQAKVVMPDCFDGKPFPASQYPPDTDEKKAALQAFFGQAGNFQTVLPRINKVLEALVAEGKTSIGAYGACWGGKLAATLAASPTLKASAAVHPAMLNQDDFNKIAIPFGLFPSKDEPLDDLARYFKSLEGKSFAAKSVYKAYPTVHHGWAAARANLDDPENFKQFTDFYTQLVQFFHNNL